MSIRGLIIGLVLLGAAGLVWQQREPLQSWFASAKLPTTASPPRRPARPARPRRLPRANCASA